MKQKELEKQAQTKMAAMVNVLTNIATETMFIDDKDLGSLYVNMQNFEKAVKMVKAMIKSKLEAGTTTTGIKLQPKEGAEFITSFGVCRATMLKLVSEEAFDALCSVPVGKVKKAAIEELKRRNPEMTKKDAEEKFYQVVEISNKDKTNAVVLDS